MASHDEIRAQILAKAGDVTTKYVDVPEWGMKVRIRELSTAARLQWQLAVNKATDEDAKEPGPDPTALLVILGVIDDDGARVFHLQDADSLAEGNGNAVTTIGEGVMKLSKLTSDDEDEAGKDSGETPSGDSPTASPETSDAPSDS